MYERKLRAVLRQLAISASRHPHDEGFMRSCRLDCALFTAHRTKYKPYTRPRAVTLFSLYKRIAKSLLRAAARRLSTILTKEMLVYLVTGASRGIGYELCRQLVARGEVVIAAARTPEKAANLKELESSHSGKFHLVTLDVEDASTIQASTVLRNLLSLQERSALDRNARSNVFDGCCPAGCRCCFGEEISWRPGRAHQQCRHQRVFRAGLTRVSTKSCISVCL